MNHPNKPAVKKEMGTGKESPKGKAGVAPLPGTPKPIYRVPPLGTSSEKKSIPKKSAKAARAQKNQISQTPAFEAKLEAPPRSEKKPHWFQHSLAKSDSGATSESTKSKTAKNGYMPHLAREEWDFCEKTVSNNDLGFCLLYEYAREKLKRSPTLTQLLSKYSIQGATDLEFDQFRRYFSGPYGFSIFGRDLASVPWLKSVGVDYDPSVKQGLGVRSKQEPLPALFMNADISEERTLRDFHFFKSSAPTHMDPTLIDPERPQTTPTFIYPDRSQEETPNLRFGFFCFDFNSEVTPTVQWFKSWYKSQRANYKTEQEGDHGKKSNRKGKLSKQWPSFTIKEQRSLLKYLGAARLRETMSITDATNFSTKHSGGPIFNNVKEWSESKRRVEEAIKTLFPLSPSEQFASEIERYR